MKTLLLVISFMLFAVNGFTAGDLQVDGSIGIGNIPVSSIKLNVLGINQAGGSIKSMLTSTSPSDGAIGLNITSEIANYATGWSSGVLLTTKVSSNASTVGGMSGAEFGVSFRSTSGGTTTIAEAKAGGFTLSLSSGDNRDYNVTQGYGFNLQLEDNRNTGNGDLHFDDFKYVNIKSPTNTNDGLSIDNLAGIWIEPQTLTGTSTNYGFVLNGSGSGSDACFGPYQEICISHDSATDGLKITGLPTSAGTLKGAVCSDTNGVIYVDESGSCN